MRCDVVIAMKVMVTRATKFITCCNSGRHWTNRAQTGKIWHATCNVPHMPSPFVITARLTVFSVHWQLSLLLLKSDSFHMTCHSKCSGSFLALFLNYKFVCHLVGLFQRHYLKSHDSLVHLSHFVDQLQLISFTHIKNSLTAAIAQVFICWEHAFDRTIDQMSYPAFETMFQWHVRVWSKTHLVCACMA